MTPPHLAKILLTGASGTLGYNVVQHLATTHPCAQIVLLMRSPDPALFANCGNVKILHVDMFDSVALKRSVFDIEPNAIIHCAASGVPTLC